VSHREPTAPPLLSAPARKIAFIKRGRYSGTNSFVRRELERQFPGHELCEIDVGVDLLKRHPHILALNWLHVFLCYGWAILRKRRPLGMCFYYTPYIARAIRRLLLAHLAPRAQDFAFSFATQSLYNAKIPGLPHFIYTDHTHLANLRAPSFDRAFLATSEWIALERQVYHDADRIFVMGENTSSSLIEQYGEDPARVRCIYGGQNTDSVKPPLDNNDYCNQTVLFIGVEWERKGGPELVTAFTQLAARLPKARLRIVGTSPKISHPQIEVLGLVPVERIPALIAQACVLCLPSRYEPFGIVVLEAFAQKVPAVVTRVDALAHLVKEGVTGRVVEPGDTAALAAALEDLLLHPEKCRAYGEAAHSFAAEHFTWESVGLKIRYEVDAFLEQDKAVDQ